jgi:8-oxo-dGTP pyrophosphatase MutT (NUDIX family)
MREATRAALLASLRAHEPGDAVEERALGRIIRFVEGADDPFSRDTREGHVTGSAVVCDPAGRSVLLVYHRKLDRWLQPGGHAHPGDASVLDVAMREAREETGLDDFAAPLGDRVLHVDVHDIPARGAEPAHLHYDVRYLLTAPLSAPRAHGAEVSRAAWFELAAAGGLEADASLMRALARARDALRALGTSD